MKSKSKRPLLTLATIAALAQPTTPALAKHHGSLLTQAKASRQKAARAALMQVPKGKIKFTELELAHGRLVWCFDISMRKTTNITEIEVDAKTGEIVSSQVQTPEDHLRDEAAETADRTSRVIYRSR